MNYMTSDVQATASKTSSARKKKRTAPTEGENAEPTAAHNNTEVKHTSEAQVGEGEGNRPRSGRTKRKRQLLDI